MSDYDDKEISLQDSAPLELFEFVGTYKSYYMTSDNLERVFSGKTYRPVPGLKRNNIEVGTHDDAGLAINVHVPISEQIVKDYGLQSTPPSLILTIYRFQRDAASYVAYWKGPIGAISISEEFASFKAASKLSSLMQGSLPSVYIQPPCNHVLFDSLCKVSRAANSIDTTVTAISGRVITIASIGSFANGWFVGGELALAAHNERRMIVAQNYAELTVNYEFSSIAVGASVQATAGCDHSYAGANGCGKFNNKVNFGGFPFVPGESNNVFISGLK